MMNRSVWSVSNIGNKDMQKVAPFQGVKKVVYNLHWGGNGVQSNSPIVFNVSKETLTWMDLWNIAEDLIVESQDEHHVFIEKFIQEGDTLKLYTGS